MPRPSSPMPGSPSGDPTYARRSRARGYRGQSRIPLTNHIDSPSWLRSHGKEGAAMRHAASLLPSCLLGLVMGIVLLVSRQSPLIPAVEVALASESGEDSATTATGGVKI